VKSLSTTLNGLPDGGGGGGFFHGYRSEEAKPSGFVPVAIPMHHSISRYTILDVNKDFS
jgi:hypothetical protein